MKDRTPAKAKCECSYGYCCDRCGRLSAKGDPCKVKDCKNPSGHTGEHGPFNNTGVIRITAEDILGALHG